MGWKDGVGSATQALCKGKQTKPRHSAVPHSLFPGFFLSSYDCSNPIFGRTLNPFNPQKSPGGSSGGEGALIAGGGSILGIGSDMGGSIRLPSSFCGLCGLKPTAERLRWVLGLPFQPCSWSSLAEGAKYWASTWREERGWLLKGGLLC